MSKSKFYAAKMQMLLEDCWKGTIYSLAKEARINRPYIHHLLSGKIAAPSFDHLLAISKTVGFSVSWWAEPLEAGPPQLDKETKSAQS